MLIILFRKPKNQRVKRALEKREPKIYENDKTAVFIRGGHTSEIVTQFLAELVFGIKYILSFLVLHMLNKTFSYECSLSVTSLHLCRLFASKK